MAVGWMRGGAAANGEPTTVFRVGQSVTLDSGSVLVPRRVGGGSRKMARGGAVETTYFSIQDPIRVVPEILVRVPQDNIHYGEQLAYAQAVLDEVFAGEASFATDEGGGVSWFC